MAGPGGRSVGRVSITVVPDVSQFSRKLKSDLAKIEKRNQVKIPVTLDTTGLMTDARMTATRIKQEFSKIKATPKLGVEPGSTAKVEAQIKAITRPRTIDIKLNLAKRSLAGITAAIRQLSGAQYLRPILQHINMDVLQLIQVASAFGAALVQVAGAMSALVPAAIGLAGVIGGTLFLAFSSLDDSLPAFARVQSAMESFKDEMNTLRSTVQTNFFSGLETQVTALGNTYLPVLTKGLGEVASALNVVAVQAAKGLLDPAVVSNTKTLIDNTRKSVENFAPAVRNIIRAFSDLSAVGSQFFPGMATGASVATKRFQEFIAEAKKSGELKEFMRAGIDTLKQLGRIAGNVGTSISGIVKAIQEAGGSASLNAIESATAALSKYLNSARGQNTITDLFKSLNTGLSSLSKGMNKAGPAIEGLVGVLGTALEQVGSVLGAALGALGPALEPLIPILDELVGLVGGALTQAFELLGPPLKTITEALATALAPVMPVLADAFAQLGEALQPVVKALGEGIAQAITAIAPMLPALVDAALQLALAFVELMVALTPLIPPLTELAMTVFMSMIQYLPQVIGFIAGLVSWFASLVEAVAPVIAKVTEFVTGIYNGSININKWIGDMVTKVGQWLADMGEKVNGWKDKLGDAFKTAANYVKNLPGNVWNSLQKFASDVRTKFSEAATNAKNKARELLDKVISFLSQLPGKAKTQITNFKNNVVNGVRTAASNAASRAREGFERMKKAISDKITSAVNEVKKMPGKIKAGLGNLGSLLYNAGKDVIRGFANGIRAMAGEAKRAAQNIANSVASTIKGALRIGSPSKLMREYGGWTSEGLALGIEDELDRVKQAAVRLAGAATPNMAAVPVAGAEGAAAAAGTTFNQTVYAGPGMDERKLANESLRQMAFALRR